ncbi:MAG TPA: DMT family transporter [Beijerinckiaceae bacterium]|nr:DMT family transporter [Beijerinckiaceae bacterium]
MNAAQASPAFVARHLFLCSLGWGSSFLFMKLMAGSVDPVVIAAVRAILAAGVLAIWVGLLGQMPLPRTQELVPWLVLGTFSGWIPNLLVAVAVNHLDSGPAALIQASSPLMTAVGAHVLFSDERMGRRRLIGVALGLCGVALLIGPRAFEGGGATFAVACMLAVAACYAATNLYTKTIRDVGAERLALGQQAISALAGLLLALVFSGPQGFAAAAPHLWLLLALGLWSTAMPMAVFMRLIRAAGPTRSAMTGYTVPTVAALLGIIVLGERLTTWQWIGGAVALAGVALVTTSTARPE